MNRQRPENFVPQPFGKLFASYDCFNKMQIALLDDLLNTDKSMVLSAPTGSGKTVAFELAFVRMLQITKSQEEDNKCKKNMPKAVYIAPIKALCSEKFTDWKRRFETVGVICIQLTGDTESYNLSTIWEAQIIISTPEKWDSLTRRQREFEQLLPSLQLFIVDEVHLLNEDTRGPILETIVARMKSKGVQRFIVASATIPNAEDLTNWIRGVGSGMQVVQRVFDDMQRPVPLEKHVIGFSSKLRGFQFDMRLNYQLPDILRKYAENMASLVFCNSRKSAEMAAFNLNKTSQVFVLSENQKLYLSQLAPSISDVKLRKLVENGIAYHHAGLQYADRNLIESSFRQGFLMVLISTTTLALGINLPAHLVVIKSTETYSCGSYTEYPESMLLQMIGRAGRPQYDKKGVAVIMTEQKNVQKYEKLLNGTAPIESHLHKHLIEHLNSEISLSTIKNLEMAMIWVRSTYLYIRAVRNPKHYGFEANLSKDFVERKLEELCLRQINALQDAGLVKFDPLTSTDVNTTVYGQLMTKYYLSYETMKLFQQQINGEESLQDLLQLLVQCKEMKEFMLRVNEKKVLNELNKTPLRYPIQGRIKTNEEKISCIIQAVLGNVEITAPALIQESFKIMRIAERISNCLLKYVQLRVKVAMKEKQSKWYGAMLNAVTIAKCLHAKLWENSEFAAKQLHGIGTVYSNALAKFGKGSLKSIAKTDARIIENLLNKTAPFGDEVLKHLMSFPEYQLKFERKNKCFAQIYVKQVNEMYENKGGDASTFLVVGDTFNNLLLVEEHINSIINERGFYECLVKLQQVDTVEHIYGHVIHTSLVGVDAYAILQINAPKNPDFVLTTKPKKQSLLTFSFDDSFFDKTRLSDESELRSKNSKDDDNLTMATNIQQRDDCDKFFDSNFNSPMKANAADESESTGQSDDFEQNFDIDKISSNLEHFRLNKKKMKNSMSNETLDIDNTPLSKIQTEKTFNDNSNTTTLMGGNLDVRCKKERIKQRKLTDFFRKSKKIVQKPKKYIEIFDVTAVSDKSLELNETKSSFDRTDFDFNEDLEKINFTQTELDNSNGNTNHTKKENSNNLFDSVYNYSDEMPLTIIPTKNNLSFSSTHSNKNDCSPRAVSLKRKMFDNVRKHSPWSLASFLADPDELNKSDPMIKLTDDTTTATKKATRRTFLSKINEPERIHLAQVKLIKPLQRSAFINNDSRNDLFVEKVIRDFEIENQQSHVTQNKRNQADTLDFERLKFNDFQLSPNKSFEQRSHVDYRALFLDSSPEETIKRDHKKHFTDTKQIKDNDMFSDNMSKPLPIFKIIAKVEPNNNIRKRLNDSSSSLNSFQKLIRNESLLASKESNSPISQNSPLDLSKAAILKNKNAKNFIKTENKSTQTNLQTKLTETQNQKPSENELMFWHKVALHFRKIPLQQAQSLTNFQVVYNLVRQRQEKQQSPTRNRLVTLKSDMNKNLSADAFGDRNLNLSNLNVKQQTNFRLKLFDNENKSLGGPKLNRREIKLINQNVMSLVLQKKCQENTEELEREQILLELDKLECELGLKNPNNFN